MKFRFFQIHFEESIILLHFSLLREKSGFSKSGFEVLYCEENNINVTLQ
jgi:hypothetical protein